MNANPTVYNHRCLVLRMPEMEVAFFSLSGRPLIKSRNWGTHQVQRD